MPVNSRAKGARFERKIAKQFEEAWGVVAVRTPLSGGWGKIGLRSKKEAQSERVTKYALAIYSGNGEYVPAIIPSP